MRLVDFIKGSPLLDIPLMVNQYNKGLIYDDADIRYPKSHSPANAVRRSVAGTFGVGLHYNYMRWYVLPQDANKQITVSGKDSIGSVTTRFSAVKDRALVPFFPKTYRESKCLRIVYSGVGGRGGASNSWLYRVRIPFPTPNYIYTIKLHKEDSTRDIGQRVTEINTVVKDYKPLKSPEVIIEKPSEPGDIGTLELKVETIPDGWIMGEYIVSEVYPRHWSGYGAMGRQQKSPISNQRISYYHAVTFIENRAFSGGYVISVLSVEQGLYKVNFRGKEETAKAVDFSSYKAGDFVLLLWHYDTSQTAVKDWSAPAVKAEVNLKIIRRQGV